MMRSFPPMQNKLILGLIILLGLVIYSNTWNVPFQFDDSRHIEENWSIRNLTFETLPKIWVSNQKTRFLPYLSFAANWKLGGSGVMGYHVFNFGVHALNAFWVYFLISLLLATPKMRQIYPPKTAFYLSAFSALIFMAHPLQTQAVTYIAQRITSMAAFFYLGAVVLYLKARLGSGVLYYGGALGMAVGAMFCKENAISLPLAIIMVDLLFFEQKEGRGKALLRGMPFLAVVLLVFYFSGAPHKISHVFDAMKEGVAIGDIIPVKPHKGVLPCGKYFLTQLSVLCTYLRLFFFPVNQNLYYDYPVASSLMEPGTLFCAFMLLGLVAVGVGFLKRNRLVSFSIFWFFLTLSVESSIIPIKEVIFEHRMYLPLAGCAVILPMVMIFLWKNLFYAVVAGTIVVSVFSGMTYVRNQVWSSKRSLWEDVIKKSPQQMLALNNLGIIYAELGRKSEAKQLFEESLRLHPGEELPYTNMGVYYLQSREPEKAMDYLKEATKRNPKAYRAWFNLGNAYMAIMHYGPAIQCYQHALAIHDSLPGAHYELANAYLAVREPDRAIAHYKKVLSLEPKHKGATDKLNYLLKTFGEYSLR